MSGPHVAIDPQLADPLTAFDHAAELAEAEDRGIEIGREQALQGERLRMVVALVGGAIIGAGIAILVLATGALAAPRSADEGSPATASRLTTDLLVPSPVLHPSSGAPLELDAASDAGLSGSEDDQDGSVERSGAPITEPDATEGGIAAYADPSYGPRYLALPEGPGAHVTICAGGRCIERVSTDAGPALFRQAEGRVADLSFVDFAWLCRCDPPDVGLLEVTIIRGSGPGITAPPTDVKP